MTDPKPERPDLDAIERRLEEAKPEHDAHPGWPCEDFGCETVEALLSYARSLEADLTRLRAAALTVESQYPKDDAPASILRLRAALREKGAEE